MTIRIGFIGAGKVGCSLGKHIALHGGSAYSLSGYLSRNADDARRAASFAGGRAFGTIKELLEESDALFLTVPDGKIKEVWNQLSEFLPAERTNGLFVGHCSGAQSSDVFEDKFENPTVFFGSAHPLVAVYDRETAYKKLEGAYFTIEGSKEFLGFAKDLMATLKNPFCEIQAENKTEYHAASVMVSNFVCALAYMGTETFENCGLDSDFAERAWRGLFIENAKNVASLGPVAALTGPIERGDAETVRKHLAVLTGTTRDIYFLLSQVLVEIAEKKNPQKDYSELRSLLSENPS